MLTPLSSLSSPNTIDIGSTPISVTPAQSPTGIATPNPSTTSTGDQSSKASSTRKSVSTSSTGSSSSSSSGSGAQSSAASSHSIAHSIAAKPTGSKIGGQPHTLVPHPQQPSPGTLPLSSSRDPPLSGAQLQKGSTSIDAGKMAVGGGGVATGGGGGKGVAGPVGGDRVTSTKTTGGTFTASAVNQRQVTHSNPTQGV